MFHKRFRAPLQVADKPNLGEELVYLLHEGMRLQNHANTKPDQSCGTIGTLLLTCPCLYPFIPYVLVTAD